VSQIEPAEWRRLCQESLPSRESIPAASFAFSSARCAFSLLHRTA
jgi:hypothetical protein